ncbi:PREDICTED: headcase protein [Diuraphis noxia]|uniref:headcase protein n=1 Tax=Diuraphis noxia TaxID=143948 RepID=UPI0007639246|nr:PREDICTED: headcase protein [Diuraphis noxia]
MAPRRNAMGFNGIGHFADLFGPSTTTAMEQLFQQQQQQPFQLVHQQQQLFEECCVPTGDCIMRSSPIRPEDPRAAELYARVVCSDGGCSAGRYMHRECFDAWERLVLVYMKNAAATYANGNAPQSNGRRIKDLWTVNVNNNNVVNLNKKGYEMAFKACGCRCGRGYLKKDSEWPQSSSVSVIRRRSSGGSAVAVDDTDSGRASAVPPTAGKKKKRRQPAARQPAVAASTMMVDYSELRLRTGSMSGSSNGSSSPVTNSASSVSPAHSGSFGSSTSTGAGSGSSSSKKRGACFKDVFERQSSMNGNGIFCRRLDFSTFNRLPRHMLNSYHVKIEDEGNHGNDETRSFILSSLAAQNQSRVNCVLCSDVMLVFDRYPLVDGTFFLSPKQYNKNAVEVKNEGRALFLNAVCMKCLDGKDADRKLCCRFCATQWDGSSLIMGTMYAYDVFAAMPCCNERLKCNGCQKALMLSHQRLNFYSDYSRKVTCPHCTSVDYHFVKPLAVYYTRQWP